MKRKNILSLVVVTMLIGNSPLYAGSEDDGHNNTYYGANAGDSLTIGSHNVFVGIDSGKDTTDGNYNVFIGRNSGLSNITGKSNTFTGTSSGIRNTTGSSNTFIGDNCGGGNVTGNNNTFLGNHTGYTADTSNSVFLGNTVGYYASRDNILMIANDDTNSSLIYGEFDTKMLRVNGTMEVNSTKIDISDAQDESAWGYPALRLTTNNMPISEMDWMIALVNEGPTDADRALIFHNQAQAADTTPFAIINNAKNELLALENKSVIVNGENIDTGDFPSPANLIVGGDIMAVFDADGTNDITELISLSVNNTDTSMMSDTGFKLTNAKESVSWTFRTLEDDSLIPNNHNAFAISKKASGAKEIIITSKDDNGGMKMILANGASCVGGNWINASSRALKENIEELSTADALKAFRALKPVTYNYKIDKNEKVVGFIAEDVPELVAVNTRNGLSSMDMVAVLTKVVQAQDNQLKVQAEKIIKLEAMQKRLAKVESLLTNLALDTSRSVKEKVSLNIK